MTKRDGNTKKFVAIMRLKKSIPNWCPLWVGRLAKELRKETIGEIKTKNFQSGRHQGKENHTKSHYSKIAEN